MRRQYGCRGRSPIQRTRRGTSSRRPFPVSAESAFFRSRAGDGTIFDRAGLFAVVWMVSTSVNLCHPRPQAATRTILRKTFDLREAARRKCLRDFSLRWGCSWQPTPRHKPLNERHRFGQICDRSKDRLAFFVLLCCCARMEVLAPPVNFREGFLAGCELCEGRDGQD